MLIIGFLALCQSFLAERATTSVAITIPSVVVIILLWFRPTDDHDSDCSEATPIKLPEWGILTIKPFFRTRFDFLSTSFDLCGKSIFQFKLLRVRPPSSPFRLSIFSSAQRRCNRTLSSRFRGKLVGKTSLLPKGWTSMKVSPFYPEP